MENEIDKKIFAQRLKELRKSRGLTQEQVCELTGIEVSNYSKMETGKVAPSFNSLQRLINLAGFIPNELFEHGHLISEKDIDDEIFKIYKDYTINKKQLLYKIMRSLEEYR